MGFSRVQTFLYVVLPQTVRRILPVYKGEFISLVKMTSIVGYIAVQDLTKASDIIRSRTFRRVLSADHGGAAVLRNLLGACCNRWSTWNGLPIRSTGVRKAGVA